MANYNYTYNIHKDRYKLDRHLLGNKGVNLVNLHRLGIPTPQGFIISTQAWKNEQHTDSETLSRNIWDEVLKRFKEVQSQRKTSNSSEFPLLVSVRSGSAYSMPGMMDSILNVGLNEKSIPTLSEHIGEWAAYDSYRRLIQMFGATVFQIHEGLFIQRLDEYMQKCKVEVYKDLSVNQIKQLIQINKEILTATGKSIPQDPLQQLNMAVKSVFSSWDKPGAVAYRDFNGVPYDIGTAVVVQEMVFGNATGTSGTGVFFTRNPKTGENKPFGEILARAQGEDVVSGYYHPVDMDSFPELFGQKNYALLTNIGSRLEKHFHMPQDIEFTIENGKLWILQTRNAKFTGQAVFKVVESMIGGKEISMHEAIRMISPGHIIELTKGKFLLDQVTLQQSLLTKGIPASYGVCTGQIALSPAKARDLSKKGINPILVMDHIDPNDIDTLIKSAGIITTKGGSASHMAIIMRAVSKPGIVGTQNIVLEKEKILVGDNEMSEEDWISFDGGNGEIYNGKFEIEGTKLLSPDEQRIIKLREQHLGKSGWSAACYKVDKKYSRKTVINKIDLFLDQCNWKSTKSRTIDLLNHLFPETEMISSKVISPSDKKGLRNALIDVIESGYENAPRTTHYPEKLSGAPWSYGPNRISEIDEFISGKWKGKYKGFSEWKKDKTFETVIVSKEQKGKMDPDLAKSHFSFTVSLLEGIIPKVVVSINLGSPHLRQFERVSAEELLTLTASINPDSQSNLGAIKLQLGQNHLKKNIISKVLTSKKNDDLWKIQKILKNTIHHNSSDTGTESKLLELIEQGLIPLELYRLIVKEDSMLIVNEVRKKTFEQWWKPSIALPHLMCALEDTTGASVLEGQGRVIDKKVSWCLIYGVKGSEEKEKAKLTSNITNNT